MEVKMQMTDKEGEVKMMDTDSLRWLLFGFLVCCGRISFFTKMF